jgi:glycosyltransferase involved in cell wall biosynthesis
MRIAIGYHWFLTAAGYHLERALRDLGHTLTYVGLPCGQRPGYDSTVSLCDIITASPQPPDLYLWIDPAGRYFPPGIEDLPIPTACYLVDVHLGTWRQQVARLFDAVFVAQKDYVGSFRRVVGHDQIYWLPLAAAPDVHRQLDLPKIYDVGFVGNIALAHRNTPRARRLKLLADRFSSNDFYRQYTPEEVGQVYSQSRIVFNTSIAGDVTMRVFEGTACGAMVLTDSVANGLNDLFEIGREIVTYENDADLLDKVDYYLAHKDECSQIARAGYQRTQAQHTYRHRAQRMLENITAPTFNRLAPMRKANLSTRRAARREVYTHLHMVDAILDESRAAQANPLARAWAVLPVLARRLIR